MFQRSDLKAFAIIMLILLAIPVTFLGYRYYVNHGPHNGAFCEHSWGGFLLKPSFYCEIDIVHFEESILKDSTGSPDGFKISGHINSDTIFEDGLWKLDECFLTSLNGTIIKECNYVNLKSNTFELVFNLSNNNIIKANQIDGPYLLKVKPAFSMHYGWSTYLDKSHINNLVFETEDYSYKDFLSNDERSEIEQLEKIREQENISSNISSVSKMNEEDMCKDMSESKENKVEILNKPLILSNKEMCYVNVAANKYFTDVCDEITDTDIKDYCYLVNVNKSKAYEPCREIVDTDFKDECYMYAFVCKKVSDEKQDNCNYNNAVRSKDSRYCSKIDNQEMQMNCNADVLINSDDENLCQYLLDEEKIEECLANK